MTKLTGLFKEPAAGGKAQQLVIMCHGEGTEANDLMQHVGKYVNRVPHAAILAPDGPEDGDRGRGLQWFTTFSKDAAVLEEGVRKASALLDAYIDEQLKEWKVRDYVLLGFSQGAAVALHSGLRHPHAPMGIISFAGGLIGGEKLAAELRNRVPVLLGHGEKDNIVPVTLTRNAEKALRANGVPVYSVYEPELGHNVGQGELNAAGVMLTKLFGSKAA